MSQYITVGREADDEFTVKRSRFIGYVKPVSTRQQADDFVSLIRAEHRDATHNVYAYVLRQEQFKRYSDDGEPQGTAGMPVLDVLLKQQLTDCAVVVTRYFGGILLGTGGLVHAYSQAAAAAVKAGGIITMDLCTTLEISCDYTQYGRLPSLIAHCGGRICDTVFADNVGITMSIPSSLVNAFRAELTEASCGKLTAKVIKEQYEQLKS